MFSEHLEAHVRNDENLLILLFSRFLRKEKEIAEAKLGVVQAESTRFKQRMESLERQVTQGNQALAEERERSQVRSKCMASGDLTERPYP